MFFKKILSPILNPFSKPQWQAKNPQTRKKGIQELLEPGNPELANIALKDQDDSVRICAINRLSDLDTLQSIIMSETSEEVTNASYNQYNQMLAGEKFPIPALEEREKIIKGCRNSRSLEYLAVHAKETDLRKIAVKKISRDSLLGNIALEDKNSDIRLLAAQQIGKKSTLERVTKKSRNKDKRVYKTTKDKLNNIIEDEQRPGLLSAEVTDIIDKLEKLHKRNGLLIEKTTFENLTARWQEIINYANAENSQRYETISKTIQLKIDALEEQQRHEVLVLQNLKEIIVNLTAEANELLQEKELNNLVQIEEKQKIIRLYKQSWEEQIADIQSQEKQPLMAQYHDILTLIEQSEDTLPAQSGYDLANHYITQLDNLNKDPHHLGEKIVNTLEDKFEKEYRNFDPQVNQSKELLSSYHVISQQLQTRLSKQKQEHQELSKKLEKQLNLIAEKVEEGLTDEAQKLKNTYITKIEHNNVLSNTEKRQFLDSLKNSGNQLNQLTSWKNWANNQERENLCNKAEQLLASIQTSSANIELIYNQYAEQIKTLRSQWKQLKGRSPDELWNRFNTACNTAFERFEPFFEKQAKTREDNLHSKQKIVEQLQTYVEYMAWPLAPDQAINPQTDWKQVQSILSQAKKEWNSIKQVDRKASKSIFKAFEQYTGIIENELKKSFAENLIQYNQLIDNIYALQETLDEDLNSAIAQAKSLQQDWKKIGPVQHYQRKKLWKKFRKGCDIIFAKRDEKNNLKQQENETLLMEKVGLCENLEALNQQALSFADLSSAFNDIANLWAQLKPQARQISGDINKRYQQAIGQFNSKIAELKEQQLLGQVTLLSDKAEICAQIEQLQPGTEDLQEKLEQAENHWQALEHLLNADDEKSITRRYEQAKNLLFATESFAALNLQSTQEKESLCLRLEIATGHQSPESEHQSRMELQVKKLNSAMTNQDDFHDEFHDDDRSKLLTLWYMLPVFPEHKALEERFFNIINEK